MKQQPKSFLSQGARWVLAPLSLAVLAACGGSSSDGPAPGPVTKYLVNGQVAVGALVEGAAVEITCFIGGGIARAHTDGSGTYEIELEEGSVRPCVGEAIIEGGSTMRSVIPGGEPNVTRINFSPLTDALVSYMMGQTAKGSGADPRELVRDSSSLFHQLNNSRAGFNNSRAEFQAYFEQGTGISLAGFDYLVDPIVIGEPSDNALEQMGAQGLLNDDGALSDATRGAIEGDAPPIVAGDIPACDAPGNSCGGEAGKEVVITGGGGN